MAVADQPLHRFLSGLTPAARPVAERIVAIVQAHAPFDAAIKWGQLTFAVDNDFDHWICAVAASKHRVNLTFHFGNLLSDRTGAFAPSDNKYVRKITFAAADEVDDAVVHDLLTQAVDRLPYFRQHYASRSC